MIYVFFLVISQFQIILLGEVLLIDVGLRAENATGKLVQRVIYSSSEIVLLLGIYFSMVRSIRTLEEEHRRREHLITTITITEGGGDKYAEARKLLSINIDDQEESY